MIARWQWLLLQLKRKLWVRVSLFCIAALLTAMAGVVFESYLPENGAFKFGSKSIDSILTILASSMLAVTTFSLTTMVSAYAAATSNATPRATKLLIDDPTTQNALGTFIGSFLYSLVGIIALSADAYGDRGRLILFLVTIGVIALIVITLLRWIDYLARLGRVGETTDRVERATLDAVHLRVAHPFLGGHALRDPENEIPNDAKPTFAERIGYIQHIDIRAISDCAQKHEGKVYIAALPGAFADPVRPLFHSVGIDDEEALESIRIAFTIDDERSFDQDPRFGLCVLSEIASRALSPALNDPGTAIDVIGRTVRVLSAWAPGEAEDTETQAPCPCVWVPPIRTAEMFDDVFTPIARDGAGHVEVQMRLQKAFAALAAMGDQAFKSSAQRHSRYALTRAEAALHMDYEKDLLKKLAAEVDT